MRFGRTALVAAAFAVALGGPAVAFAAVSTLNFTQGTNGDPVPAPAPYTAERAIYTETLTYKGQSLGQLNNVTDIYVDNVWHNLWITDTGNNRIIELAADPDAQGNPQYDKVLLVLGGPNATGDDALNGPKGMCVDSAGIIYVADTGNGRIATFAPDGVFLKNLDTTNSTSLKQQGVKFVPDKVAVDQRGTIYTVLEGQAFGLAEFNSDGDFLGFFAPNSLSFSATLKYRVAKLLQTQSQKSQQASVLPPEVSNVYVGPDGYIYTTSTSVDSKQIRRLNVVGTDTLNVPGTAIVYGLPLSALPDYVFQQIEQMNSGTGGGGGGGGGNNALQPKFTSISEGNNGIITALDQLTDFVFQYGQEGELLYTFGGLDNGNGVLGLFETPTAVAEAPNGEILVADTNEADITIFQPTEFAQLVQQGAYLYSIGQYAQAQVPWSKVLAYDTNYDLAHLQMGQGWLSQGELLGAQPAVLHQELGYFSQALHEFYLANDKPSFGLAFGWYRHIWMRINFTWVFLAFILAWLAIYLLWKVLGTRVRERPIAFEGAWVRNQFVRMVPMAWRVIKHPAEAFFQLKYEGQGTLYQGVALIVIAFLVHVGNLALTDFDFSVLVRGRTNLVVLSGQFLLPLVTWIVANYLVGDLYEGEANLAEVVTGSAYAMLPFIVLQLPFAFFTHGLAPSDGIYRFMYLFQKLWIIYLFFTQVRVLHNLDWGQAIKASVMTLVGIGVLWTMFFIVYGLGQQAFSFVHQIIREVLLLHG